MSQFAFLLTPDLARAGRALTQVSRKTIAAGAGIDPATLKAYERGVGPLTREANLAVKAALEAYGAVFLPESDGMGYGVRQKYSDRKVERIQSWENEGGPAGHDDV